MKFFSILSVSAGLIMAMAACSDNNQAVSTPTITEVQTSTDSNQAEAPSSAAALPAFSVQDVNGKPLNLQHFKGKKVFVNLWATWCPPCRAEMPSIQKLYQSVDTSKVAFVMLSLDDNFVKAKAYTKKQKLDFPIYYPAEELPAFFNVQVIPTTFIFNENGDLVKRIDGGDNYDSQQYRNLLK